MKIKYAEDAAGEAIRTIAKLGGTYLIGRQPLNLERHYLLKFKKRTGETELVYLLFKRDVFKSFGAIFNTDGVGESINLGILNQIIENGIPRLCFAYPSGAIYEITPQAFLEQAYRNGYFRRTSTGEMTASIPIKELKRIN